MSLSEVMIRQPNWPLRGMGLVIAYENRFEENRSQWLWSKVGSGIVQIIYGKMRTQRSQAGTGEGSEVNS